LGNPPFSGVIGVATLAEKKLCFHVVSKSKPTPANPRPFDRQPHSGETRAAAAVWTVSGFVVFHRHFPPLPKGSTCEQITDRAADSHHARELADLCRVSPETVRRWCHQDLLPYTRVGRRFLFDPVVLQNFQRSHKGESP